MKSENEIRSKIDSLIDVAFKNVDNSQYYEAICDQVVALLWVINSGERNLLLDQRPMPSIYK